jgi:hypothetical protein
MTKTDHGISELELQRIASLNEAAHLRGVSVDTLIRTASEKIIELGPRRRGMRVKDALMIDDSS